MSVVHIESGICGFKTLVRASQIQGQGVGIVLESGCAQIMAFGGGLRELGIEDILKIPINQNPIYEKAGKCNLHASCPVPCGVIKAAEVELGLALKGDVRITFHNSSH